MKLPPSGQSTRRKTYCDGCGRSIMTSLKVRKDLCKACEEADRKGEPLLSDRVTSASTEG